MLLIRGGWNTEGSVHRYDDAEGLYLRDRRDDPLRARKENGKSVVPHATTIACAELFDQIQAAKKE